MEKSHKNFKQFQEFMGYIESRNPGEIEFIQSVYEVAEGVIPFVEEHKIYK